MKKFFTNLRNHSENNRGFSLVELIIVIAIMVALVAMLAPQFVKYVSKSRDAVVISAAEDVLSVAKAEYSFGNLYLADGKSEGTIRVQSDENGKIVVTLYDVEYKHAEGETSQQAFENMCGIDPNKSTLSKKVYLIHIEQNEFSSTEGVFTEEVTDGGNSTPPENGG